MAEDERRERNHGETRQDAPALGTTAAETQQEARLRAQILKSKIRTVRGVDSNFNGEETMGWLVKMDDSAMSADETIMPGKLLDASQMTMPRLVDIIFDSLQRYSYEFNKKGEFVINCSRPENFQEKIDHFNRRKVRFMKGHLSSDEFSMVFYCTEASVDVYIIPTDFLVGFDPEESDFPLFLNLKKLSVQDSSSWGIDGVKISLDEFPRLSRRLLGQLIKVTRGEAVSTDKFTLSTSRQQEEEAVEPDRTFEELDDKLEALHPGEQLPSQPKQSPEPVQKPLATLAKSTQEDLPRPQQVVAESSAANAANTAAEAEPGTIAKPTLTSDIEAELRAFAAESELRAAAAKASARAAAVPDAAVPAAPEAASASGSKEAPIYEFGRKEKSTLIDEEVARPVPSQASSPAPAPSPSPASPASSPDSYSAQAPSQPAAPAPASAPVSTPAPTPAAVPAPAASTPIVTPPPGSMPSPVPEPAAAMEPEHQARSQAPVSSSDFSEPSEPSNPFDDLAPGGAEDLPGQLEASLEEEPAREVVPVPRGAKVEDVDSVLSKSAPQLMKENQTEIIPSLASRQNGEAPVTYQESTHKRAHESADGSAGQSNTAVDHSDPASQAGRDRLRDKIKLSKRHTEPILTAEAAAAESIKVQVDSAQESVVDACCVVVSGIEDALDALHTEGMEAMRSDNVTRVTEVMDESRRLRSIKEKLVMVAEEIAEL